MVSPPCPLDAESTTPDCGVCLPHLATIPAAVAYTASHHSCFSKASSKPKYEGTCCGHLSPMDVRTGIWDISVYGRLLDRGHKDVGSAFLAARCQGKCDSRDRKQLVEPIRVTASSVLLRLRSLGEALDRPPTGPRPVTPRPMVERRICPRRVMVQRRG